MRELADMQKAIEQEIKGWQRAAEEKEQEIFTLRKASAAKEQESKIRLTDVSLEDSISFLPLT